MRAATGERGCPFSQQSEMARVLNAFAWEATEIGAVSQWPAELRAHVDLLLDVSVPMMLVWGPDLRTVYNDGYIEILAEKHPAVWQPAAELFQETWDIAGPLLDDVAATGKAVKARDIMLPLVRGGVLEECYFTLSYSPLRDARGELVGLLSTAIETTEQVLAVRRERILNELAPRQPEQSPIEALRRTSDVLASSQDIPFHLLIQHHGSGEWDVAGSSGVELAPGAAERLGPSTAAGALEPVPVERLPGVMLSPEARAASRDAVSIPFGRSGVLDDTALTGVLVCGLPSGQRWTDSYRSFLRRTAELIGAQYNALRLREMAVAEAEDRYHRLFHEALDGILLGDLGREIIAVNPAACRILGHPEDSLVSIGWDLVRRSGDENWEEAIRTVRNGDAYTGMLDFEHGSGRIVTCEVSCPGLREAARPTAQTVILRDVSERLQLQTQLAEAQRAEVVARLAGGIAHDFNNLLTVIGCQSTLLAESCAHDAETREEFAVLEQAADRGASLIRRLQSFAGQYQGEERVFDPVESVYGLVPILRRLVDSSQELNIELDEKTPTLRMRPYQFEQIVMNLVVNARDAVQESGRAGRIDVRLYAKQGGVVFEVRDNGVGMSPELCEQIFEPFFTTKSRGTGIGLSTVKLLVEQNGGTLSVQSELGAGTVFELTLPGQLDPAEAAAEVESRPAPRLDGLHVLLVEDQGHVRDVLGKSLVRLGAEVVQATNGEEALRLVADTPLDVVVCDVVMPLMTGPALVRELRSRYPELAIVMVSGYVGDEAISVDTEGPVVFLAKPLTSVELAQAIRQSLSAKSG